MCRFRRPSHACCLATRRQPRWCVPLPCPPSTASARCAASTWSPSTASRPTSRASSRRASRCTANKSNGHCAARRASAHCVFRTNFCTPCCARDGAGWLQSVRPYQCLIPIGLHTAHSYSPQDGLGWAAAPQRAGQTKTRAQRRQALRAGWLRARHTARKRVLRVQFRKSGVCLQEDDLIQRRQCRHQ